MYYTSLISLELAIVWRCVEQSRKMDNKCPIKANLLKGIKSTEQSLLQRGNLSLNPHRQQKRSWVGGYRHHQHSLQNSRQLAQVVSYKATFNVDEEQRECLHKWGEKCLWWRLLCCRGKTVVVARWRSVSIFLGYEPTCDECADCQPFLHTHDETQWDKREVQYKDTWHAHKTEHSMRWWATQRHMEAHKVQKIQLHTRQARNYTTLIFWLCNYCLLGL